MVTLVPSPFFTPDSAKDILAEVAVIPEGDRVCWKAVPQFDAVMIYNVPGTGPSDPVPEALSLIEALDRCPEYNKIAVSLRDGVLSLVIAQGRTLMLANEYAAAGFTSALYFIFLAMKSLQLNPEVSTVSWRSGLSSGDESTLYRYFKSVDRI